MGVGVGGPLLNINLKRGAGRNGEGSRDEYSSDEYSHLFALALVLLFLGP